MTDFNKLLAPLFAEYEEAAKENVKIESERDASRKLLEASDIRVNAAERAIDKAMDEMKIASAPKLYINGPECRGKASKISQPAN